MPPRSCRAASPLIDEERRPGSKPRIHRRQPAHPPNHTGRSRWRPSRLLAGLLSNLLAELYANIAKRHPSGMVRHLRHLRHDAIHVSASDTITPDDTETRPRPLQTIIETQCRLPKPTHRTSPLAAGGWYFQSMAAGKTCIRRPAMSRSDDKNHPFTASPPDDHTSRGTREGDDDDADQGHRG